MWVALTLPEQAKSSRATTWCVGISSRQRVGPLGLLALLTAVSTYATQVADLVVRAEFYRAVVFPEATKRAGASTAVHLSFS